jgi:AcrR family transcriptional regulator
MQKQGDAPNRGSYHHGDLRRALLEAALGLVSMKGVEGFSLREAAREVGVSPAAAYRHFEDKSALLEALAIDGMGKLALAMEQALEAAPGAHGSPAHAAAALAAVGDAYVQFAVGQPATFQVMFGPWCDHPDASQLPPEAQPRGRDPFQILVDTLDQLVTSGAVTPAARAGAEIAAWSGVHGLASLLVAEAIPLGPVERRIATALLVRTQLLGMGCAPALLGPAAGGAIDADPRQRPKSKPARAPRRS